MNIEEIKGNLCNAELEYYGESGKAISYLLSIIEQAENAFINIRDAAMNNVEDAEYVQISDEALQAIRKGD